VETAAGITFGLAGALLLARFSSPLARRRLLVISGAGAAACVVAAVCATVVLPIA
jgi:ABC-type Fe3+-siderophore transport system permease subunit